MDDGQQTNCDQKSSLEPKFNFYQNNVFFNVKNNKRKVSTKALKTNYSAIMSNLPQVIDPVTVY